MRSSIFTLLLVIAILFCSQGRAAGVPPPSRDSATTMTHIFTGASVCSTSGALFIKETKQKSGWRVWVPAVLQF